MGALERLANAGVVPVVVIKDSKDAIPAAEALLQGGIDVMEITLRTAAGLNTIKAAKSKEAVAAELQLHSDQGFRYTSHGYFALIQKYGIIPSMSRKGNCYDNAMAKNFFSILKTECIYRQKIMTLNQAKQLIDDYI